LGEAANSALKPGRSGGRTLACAILLAVVLAWFAAAVPARAAESTATFGKSTVGASSDVFAANRKRVSRYSLPAAGTVSKLSVYLAPSGTPGQQPLEGVVYADSSGKPGSLLASTAALTFSSTNAAGWYDLTFAGPVSLAPGSYWLGVISGETGKVAGFRYDSVASARDWNANTYSTGPSNPFGTPTVDSEQMSLYATYTTSTLQKPPSNTEAPKISGAAEVGQTLSASSGGWSESPTSFTYEWQRCNSSGTGCAEIAGAAASTYRVGTADTGSTLRVAVTAHNSAGASTPADSVQTAVVTEPAAIMPPSNTEAPRISGVAEVGQTLSASNGVWSESPTSFTYEWQRCNSSGTGCAEIAGGAASTYRVGTADTGSTLRVAVTAHNSAGPSTPADSKPTAVVASAPATCGKTTVGASLDYFGLERKRVNRCTLPEAGAVSRLSVYLAPTGTAGEQVLAGVVYSDNSGKPETRLGVTEQLVFKSTQAPGWYQLPFASALKLAAGSYWIGVITGATAKVSGFRYDSVTSARDYNANTYAAGPSNPFGAVTTDSEQMSLYATYTPATIEATAPVVETRPASEITQTSAFLNARVDPGGAEVTECKLEYGSSNSYGSSAPCSPAPGAGASTVSVGASVGGLSAGTPYHFRVVATNSHGTARGADETFTTISASGTNHYEYVFPSNAIDVYDMDNGFKLIKTIPLPTAATDVRGAAACPSTHTLYVSYGHDSSASGGGFMLAYDLVGEKTLWTQAYAEGIDSMAVTPDCKTIYMPVGEASSASNWNVLEASTGNITGRIEAGAGPHNTIVSLNGEHVYMGPRNSGFLVEAETATGKVIKQIGPLLHGGVRPFTINGKETLAFTTATGFLGFQVSSIASGQVLYTVPISPASEFPYTEGQPGPSSPSHGISLSPDEKELWVMDQPNSYVHVFDISGLPASAPTQIANIKLTRAMTGSQVGCTYDCLREGWLQHTLDGRFVIVGDSGDVIDTKTRQSVANLEPLYNSRVFLEIDWSGGVPVATSTRSGIGYVTH
jgi:hypothetical protein